MCVGPLLPTDEFEAGAALRSGWRRDGEGRLYVVDACAPPARRSWVAFKPVAAGGQPAGHGHAFGRPAD